MRLRVLLGVFALAGAAVAAEKSLTLTVDAREVTRNSVHMTLDVPVSGTSARLVFPKWTPGNHAATNPVVDFVMLQGEAGGKRVPWERDPVDLYAFTFALPSGTATLPLRYDALFLPGADDLTADEIRTLGRRAMHRVYDAWIPR